MAGECDHCKEQQLSEAVKTHATVLHTYEERFATIIKMLFSLLVSVIITMMTGIVTLGVALYMAAEARTPYKDLVAQVVQTLFNGS